MPRRATAAARPGRPHSDIASGALAARVREIRRDLEPFWRAQALYRARIYREKELMRLQARMLLEGP